ncbi:thioredoxin family protein [Haloplanus aerogenes]|uniref:Thioredoxin n=1 Tax=Haloplanus aerogenes TaxID=660522 RepID=A0A3M0DRN6_9EURY|nr:thioredoxin [Haloplanus aerogenes]RMB24925.1 thiol-disulfide isomerase/thioredoxin [Haloplanus aerogenes]
MSLETMEPAGEWSGDEQVRERLGREDLTYLVWGADWCGDCQGQLPAFAAALDAAGVPADRIEQFPVDDDKQGEGVDEYGIEYIPTVVVERQGEEIARFVEEEPVSIAEYLAEQIAAADEAPANADD